MSATPSRQGLYALAAKHSKEAIETLLDLMRNAKMENTRLGAANALLNKALPDIKAMELTGNEGNSMVFKIVREVNQNAESNG